jgi:DNA-binding NarL/FixJ family response regulator
MLLMRARALSQSGEHCLPRSEPCPSITEDACPLDARVAPVVAVWAERYGLTDSEGDVLRRCALGESREAIVAARGTSMLTLQKHASNMLRRTLDESLQAAAARLLREVLERGEAYSPSSSRREVLPCAHCGNRHRAPG